MKTFLQMVIDTLADAVLVADANGIVVMVNKKTEEMFGATRTDAIGKPVESFMPERFREQHRGHRALYACAPVPRPMGKELDLFAQRFSGEEFPIEASLSPITVQGENLVIVSVADISPRVDREKELKNQIENLEKFSLEHKEKNLQELAQRMKSIIKTRAT